MTLKDYLSLPGHSATTFAAETGVSVSTITRAAEGKTIPSRELMRLIAEKTKGAVMPNDFFGVSAAGERGEAA
jgi:transcriptional regulator with XRE-family HTH domain